MLQNTSKILILRKSWSTKSPLGGGKPYLARGLVTFQMGTNRLRTDGYMTVDLKFYVLFNSISVILRQWESDNERPCAVVPRLQLERFPPPAAFEL